MSGPAARIWLADLAMLPEARLAPYVDWLGRQELARHGHFVRAERRNQFLAGRVLVRFALGALLGIDPRSIVLDAPPGRAPRLLAPAEPVAGISVSHSGRWVACAVSLQTALGLDIEVRDAGRDVMALAAQAFDAAACARLAGLPATERTHAFYAAWSEQEARFKLGVPAAGCMELPHDELAVVLCSAAPLAVPPVLELAAL